MKYLKQFANESDFQAFKEGEDFVLPNVSYILGSEKVEFEEYRFIMENKAGDIAYWDGSKVSTISPENYTDSLGTPIGIVVVPKGFAPDGKTRIVSLTCVVQSGEKYISYAESGPAHFKWSESTANTGLPFNTVVPITDNLSAICANTNSYGSLPSDSPSYTGQQSYVDPEARYASNAATSRLIPSPYLNYTPNPEFYKKLDGGNILSDFDGYEKTQTLVNLDSTMYHAANAAWCYNDGVSNLQWYLPAIGELTYLQVRQDKINNSAIMCNYPKIIDKELWSVSEKNNSYVYVAYGSSTTASSKKNTDSKKCYPFAIID